VGNPIEILIRVSHGFFDKVSSNYFHEFSFLRQKTLLYMQWQRTTMISVDRHNTNEVTGIAKRKGRSGDRNYVRRERWPEPPVSVIQSSSHRPSPIAHRLHPRPHRLAASLRKRSPSFFSPQSSALCLMSAYHTHPGVTLPQPVLQLNRPGSSST
jgi:hypothetical protein